MLLRDKVNGDIATAMKAKDAARLSALRAQRSAARNALRGVGSPTGKRTRKATRATGLGFGPGAT